VYETCSGEKLYVANSEQWLQTATAADTFCRQAHGPFARLMEMGTAVERQHVLDNVAGVSPR
jgi:hypothetical protein